ncbi:cofactor-independent phosphoglycerate mutase [Acetivibrio ethanolgignens]|uniref:Phosphoglycerate mutase n=1 Tax=Acetivibrio ethanolgignens TaxID=290052 RepID=A0A0V8QJ04_9FIRM|nr:cofactor-independent phosphoglycerate mutase [Acetivibrio ethanolgignens]KSV60603.1 phosphoglycerate mutase [Acetivibrio ethanolgignens]
MKYIVILGDGMADEPLETLGGKTPLEAAVTPMMDRLAGKSELGMAHTIPEGMSPGSDTANLAVLGYNPKLYYTGRSPLEALSIGVPMKESDVALRCNLVTLSEEGAYEEKKILDHSSSEISTEDAVILIDAVKKELENDVYHFYTGTSYRHLTLWDKGSVVPLTPPHDILGNVIAEYLPENRKLREMMKKSYDILNQHPLNIEREKKGLNKANSIWFWGAGTKPILDSFEEKTGRKGVMISAVDLLKGIGAGAGMKNILVEGANGTLHTNYKGKAKAAVDALLKDNYDFAYIHVEAPDEMSHQGSIERKIQAIEYLDREVVKTVVEELKRAQEPFRLLLLPDHPTPIRLRTHTAQPVPYLLYDSTMERKAAGTYNEKEAAMTGIVEKDGYLLINKLLGGSHVNS